MKVTLNWLKQYVDFDWTAEELAERLTMLGLEVERVHKIGGEFEGIVVAQILTRDKVPGSDKLSVCKVNDGKGECTIICGAQNHKPGDKVALILPNYSLPLKPGEKEPFVIKERKVFGVTSQGMMCSPRELGLADDAEGLLILREDARIGQPFAEYLGRAAGDVVYDLEITPNRPDLNSVIGIAREISAVTGNAVKIPEIESQKSEVGSADLVAVRIEDAELCPRYVARVARGVKVGPSPDWLRSTLEKVGIRSISNVVDVTNYVMMETGQPLHAFDYHLIGRSRRRESAAASSATNPSSQHDDDRPTIVIRRARAGEKFTTLDGQERTLTNQMLLIADETKAIALAGVMGGQNTEINERTGDVLIESACFKPQNIRATSRALELRTESSYRFERGADIGITDWASQRAAQLILQTAGGQLASGVVDAYPQPATPREITLRHAKTSELLGVEIPTEEQRKLLVKLGLALKKPTPAGQRESATANHQSPITTFRIPTFRVDLKRETDLIEEIVRLYGVDKVPATAPRGAVGFNAHDAVHDQLTEARRLLTGLGLNEAQGQTLISSDDLRVAHEATIALLNPLSSDMDVLRPSLLPGLLAALRHNLNHKIYDVALFEIGRVFAQSDGQTKEERHVGVAFTGCRNPVFWSGEGRDAKYGIFDLKGVVEEFLEHFGVRGVNYVRRPDSTSFYLESGTLQLGKQTLGELGQLAPPLAKRFDLRDAVLLAELNLDLLLTRRKTSKTFKPLPTFPAIRRDVAMFVPESVTHETVLNAVKQARPQSLESVELFDVFRGRNVPAGHKSMAYAFTYRHAERTLTDAEVNTAHEKLVEHFKQILHAVVRDAG